MSTEKKQILMSEATNDQPESARSRVTFQIKRFCQLTSLRGVPRITSSVDCKRKVLWSFFVLALFAGCIVCVTLLISQYLQYDTFQQPKTLQDAPRPFPSLTLCNLRPFTNDAIHRLKAAGVVPIDTYFDYILNIIPYVKQEHRRLLTALWTMETYLVNLPKNIDADSLGHGLEELILRCLVIYKVGEQFRGTVCEQLGTWMRIHDRVFHHCYTYTVFPNHTLQTLSMEMVLFLDNKVENTDCFDCQDRLRASQLTGARLVLHPPNSYPRVAEQGMILMPGTMTDVRFSVQEWTMMKPPHGRCNPNARNNISFDRIVYGYTEKACNMEAVQDNTVKSCGCLEQSLPIPTKFLNPKLPYCQSLYFPTTNETKRDLNRTLSTYFNSTVMDKFVNSINCAQKISSEVNENSSGCGQACVTLVYKASITAAQWPTKTFMTYFAAKLIARMKSLKESNISRSISNKTLDDIIELLSPYKEVTNLTHNERVDEAVKKLMQLDIFERNFLSIVVSRPTFDLEKIEEKEVVTLTSLLSQIGGMLSIWIGLSFVLIVELIDLFLNIIEIMCSHPKPAS